MRNVCSEASYELFPRKTLKMVDQPSIDELNTQLGLLRTWLPLMAWGSERTRCGQVSRGWTHPPAKPETTSAQIKLDSDFDLNLNNAADPSAVS